jgi:hypothetical protein
MVMSVRGVVGAAMCVVVAVSGASLRADDPVHSRWRTDDVRIDGVMTDWSELTYVSKEVATSVANDREHLYFVVATSNPAVTTQIMRAGLAVYLDGKGGKRQTFGVRIPPIGTRLAPDNASSNPDEPPLLSYFDILGPGDDDVRRVQVGELPGVAVMIGSHQGTFFLEVQVPLMDAKKGILGLGIVTPEPPRMASRGGSLGGRGGSRGAGMSGGAPPGGIPGRPGGTQGKAIKIWTTVTLAMQR